MFLKQKCWTDAVFSLKLKSLKIWSIIHFEDPALTLPWNDIFAEFDGNSGIKNIVSDRLNVGELQVDDISAKPKNHGRKYKEIYTNQVNQALSRCFFSVFSKNWGREILVIFRLCRLCTYFVAAGFYESHLKFKE